MLIRSLRVKITFVSGSLKILPRENHQTMNDICLPPFLICLLGVPVWGQQKKSVYTYILRVCIFVLNRNRIYFVNEVEWKLFILKKKALPYVCFIWYSISIRMRLVSLCIFFCIFVFFIYLKRKRSFLNGLQRPASSSAILNERFF